MPQLSANLTHTIGPDPTHCAKKNLVVQLLICSKKNLKCMAMMTDRFLRSFRQFEDNTGHSLSLVSTAVYCLHLY